jgi:hypothetical protein
LLATLVRVAELSRLPAACDNITAHARTVQAAIEAVMTADGEPVTSDDLALVLRAVHADGHEEVGHGADAGRRRGAEQREGREPL